jgi:nucleotide-binding universal stress UspA family protein
MGTVETSELVVVGVDGSADSTAAMTWAERYATSTGARLRIVKAWEWPVNFGAPVMYDNFAPMEDAKTIAEKAAAGIDLPADRLEIEVAEGYGGPVLVHVSKDADLLVVGSHGHRAVANALLGSVSAYFVRHSSVPVVVVR